jgi:N-acetylmuramoyl-L-alanine amidase
VKYNIIRKLKTLLTLGIIFTMPMLGTTIANANTDIESEFKSIINKYEAEEVVVENGIALMNGETLDLSQYPNWELSNDTTVQIDQNGKLTTLNEGTVFLSQKKNNKVHVTEIYVEDNKSNFVSQASTISRNYYKVFIDAGHGGSDSGAVGYGYRESDINLQVAKKVEAKLKAKGIEVQMSRSTDVFYGLKERADMSNAYQPDTFVSIHHNSSDSTSAAGIETYYHTNKISHKPLSDKVQTNLIKETGAKDRGVKSADFAVLRLTNNVSSLVEGGFISNQTEANNLGNPVYQEKLATGIANGVEQYLRENITLSSTDTVIKTGVVNTTSLNVRGGYGTGYPIIGTLSNSAKVDIVEEYNGWYKILYNGGYGYVSNAYITLNTTSASTFSDITYHWARPQIEDFVQKGYLNGYGDNTFRPENPIRRDEFVKLVNKLFGFIEGGQVTFTDIQPDYWAYNEIAIAVKQGYINGYPDNTFRPSDFITRESAAKIIAQITKLQGDGVLSFNDTNQIADWAKPHVDALTDNGIIQGADGNNFLPKNQMTRAEAVAMLSRLNR